MQHPQANLLVIRRYQKTLRDSCFADLQWAIAKLGVMGDWKFTVSPLEITRKSTNQKILFRGLDDAQKVASTTVAQGVLCWCWIEEAFELENESEFNRLDLSIRGTVPDGLFKQLTLVFNPWSENCWLKPRFFDVPDSGDKIALTTTYLCNEWLDAADLRVFEDMRQNHPRRYAVEGLAEWGRAEGLIYERVDVREFNWRLALRLPGAKAVFGLDFGFTDPTAFISAVVCPDDKAIFIFAEWYQSGATNEQIAKALKQLGLQRELVYCDAAEPKSIAELKKYGISSREAPKGSDSVRFGIQLLQGYQLIIHPSCSNSVIEFKNYAWAKDRYGKYTDKPDHEYSHLPDALRYAVVSNMRRSGMKFNNANTN